MNTLRIFTVLALLFPVTLLAQKFGYIDTDYILRHMPEYASAQEELNRVSSQWQIEIEGKYEAIRMLEQAYQAEKILLTTEMRQRREDEVKQKRTEAQQMQKAKFGVEGELFQRREELIKPVQDALYTAIEELASQRGYMVVFDKSNQSNMLYTNPKFDLSDDVIKKLGYKPGDTIEAGGKDGEKAGGRDAGSTPDPGGSRGGTVPAGGARGGSTRGGETVKPR